VVEKEKETQEIVGQKRRACTGTSSTSSASKEMVAAGGTRRWSKRVKVPPTRYDPVVEEESCPLSHHASSGILVTRSTTLTASRPPLENSSATTDEIMVHGSNEDANPGSSLRLSTVAATTRVHKRKKRCFKTFDERLKDLMAFKAEYGHCNVPCTRSRNNKHYTLGAWCSTMRNSYRTIKEGGISTHRLSKANIKRLENAGFQWSLYNTFDERLKDLIAFKAEFVHCNVPATQARNNNKKHTSLGTWCSGIRRSYKAIKVGGKLSCKLSKADIPWESWF
jgi:hypothetical protein